MKKIFSISVTGHRFIENNRNLVDSVRKVLTGVIEDHYGFDIFLYSPLAEGSDQLIALVAQELEEISLIVPMPLPVETYLQDFETRAGKANFDTLLKSALKIVMLPDEKNRQFAYHNLGNYLVKQCDLLIAVWNGEYTGEIGGTGEVVSSALEAGKPVYWIYSDNKKLGNVNKLREQKYEGEIQLLN